MNTKTFLVSLAIVLVITLVPIISAATYHGSFDVDVSDASINIGNEGCQEDWSGSTWSECVNNQQLFICFDKNHCGTNSLRPAQCLTTRACNVQETPSNPPGSTGNNPSGGSPSTNNNPSSTPSSNSGSCVENWKCNDWSNANEQCGTRTCEDLNKCGTTQLKPKVSEKCSTVGFLSFTGAVTGIGNFAKSGEGIATFLGLIMVVVLTILITSIRRKRLTNEKNSEPKTI